MAAAIDGATPQPDAVSLSDLASEAEDLVFAAFDEGTASRLGLILLQMARDGGLPVVISIRTADRVLFHAALPGATPQNDLWALRKSNTALRFHLASLAVGLQNRAKGQTLADHGLDPADHADHGGAVPIRVAGVGVVAVATVSGLPQVQDHRLVARAIRACLE